MALNIESEEADRLACALAQLTGESLTEAVTTALRECLARERARRAAGKDLPTRLAVLAQQLRTAYDTRPVSQEEWDTACGEAVNGHELRGS
jgi:antitoxin VapB